MYQGEPASGIEFYKLLFESNEFTSELGKVTLASGKLEAELIKFLKKRGIEKDLDKATLGSLIRIAEKEKILNNNQIQVFEEIKKQRNYITHNIYALFSDLKEETILEKKNLLDSDVQLYIERAWQLKENLEALSNNIRKSR